MISFSALITCESDESSESGHSDTPHYYVSYVSVSDAQ